VKAVKGNKYDRKINTLELWHIPYFSKMPITALNENSYLEFRRWQDEKSKV
jgi:hypothetical protein